MLVIPGDRYPGDSMPFPHKSIDLAVLPTSICHRCHLPQSQLGNRCDRVWMVRFHDVRSDLPIHAGGGGVEALDPTYSDQQKGVLGFILLHKPGLRHCCALPAPAYCVGVEDVSKAQDAALCCLPPRCFVSV